MRNAFCASESLVHFSLICHRRCAKSGLAASSEMSVGWQSEKYLPLIVARSGFRAQFIALCAPMRGVLRKSQAKG